MGAACAPDSFAGTAAIQITTGSGREVTTAPLSDQERNSVTITSYDLELKIQAVSSRMDALARISVRNDGSAALNEIPLQISSSLHWDAASSRGSSGWKRLSVAQHVIETDTDHTGAASEALLKLDQPLKAGQVIDLNLAYSGQVERSAKRLQRAGVAADEAAYKDWDGISEDGVAMRGFGNVLWYPVASEQVFLEDGDHLARAVATQRSRESGARVHLCIEVEGTPTTVAFFCGRRARVSAVNRAGATDAVVDPPTQNAATAEWPAQALGFGPLSLFTGRDSSDSSDGGVATANVDGVQRKALQAAADSVLPLVQAWLGQSREREPVLLSHNGDPFLQGAFLAATPQDAAGLLWMPRLEARAWFSSPEVWLDEGVPQFLSLLALERKEGRAVALTAVHQLQPALSLAESMNDRSALVHANREVFFWNKAVCVLWMLRSMVGDEALQGALQELKTRPKADRTSTGFETVLESRSGKDLHWFFRDWVLEDHGLPDLSILHANVRPYSGVAGRSDGTLVAVDVSNAGDAAADVPVTVRAGTLTATERLRVPAHSTASTRIPFQSKPEIVEVNDGTTPEEGDNFHQLKLTPEP